MNDILFSLQTWYASQCDGDWEHTYGIKIETLDNPGWSMKIDLIYTDLEKMSFEDTGLIQRTDENDWYRCWIEGGVFNAACGPGNLTEVIGFFIAFTEQKGAGGTKK